LLYPVSDQRQVPGAAITIHLAVKHKAVVPVCVIVEKHPHVTSLRTRGKIAADSIEDQPGLLGGVKRFPVVCNGLAEKAYHMGEHYYKQTHYRDGHENFDQRKGPLAACMSEMSEGRRGHGWGKVTVTST
jgi:hypothetical protein